MLLVACPDLFAKELKPMSRPYRVAVLSLATIATLPACAIAAGDLASAQLGPRPFYLVDKLDSGPLKTRLQACAAERDTYEPTEFSIGHRGAPLQFPEHTRQSYVAAARSGAGILECDVTFTSDAELVCRHAQCDLHTTTNILQTPLAENCVEPFQPATFDADGMMLTPASARCCASDLTLAEFKSLSGKMDTFDADAATVADYLGGTPPFRTDLYDTGGVLLTHAESIGLFRDLGTGFTPELKEATEGFGDSGLTQENYARKLAQSYVDAGVPPDAVWLQSFNYDDVRLWIDEFPTYGEQAVWLDGRDVEELARNPPGLDEFERLVAEGLRIIAPPMPVLLALNADNEIVPSIYAENARAAGLDIISWTTERSGRIVEDVLNGGQGFYYQSVLDALENDGDILEVIDVLARRVGVIGLFSDWPATTSFYANCSDLP